MKKYVFIILIGVFSIFVLYKIGYKEPYLSKTQIKTTSLSVSSAMPTQLLTIYGKGFIRTDSLSVRFFDDKGYDITLTPVQVTDTGVIVAVPPYVDFENYTFGPGTVSVQILSQSGANASDSVTLNIGDLPKFTETPGTITLQFLDEALEQITDTKRHMFVIQDLTKVSLPPDSITSLDKLAIGYTALKEEVKSVMADESKKVPFAEVDGQTLSYNQETLATADRLFGSLMQEQVTLSDSDSIMGIAVARAAGTASCPPLEGLGLNAIIACVQRYVSVDDVAMSLLEAANDAHLKNPLIEKGFKGLSFLSDVTFFAFTLPGMYKTYQQDLDTVTARTGMDEYDIAIVRNHYLDQLAFKSLGPLGTAMGIMRELIMGSEDDLYRKWLNKTMLADTTAFYAPSPDKGKQKSGLNLIVCGDLCGKEQKDFAIMAGVKGSGRIISAPAGISCPGDCTEIYGSNVDAVELSAAPDNGYMFSGWSLACSGKGACRLPSGRDRAVIATFEKEPENDVNASESEDADQSAAGGSIEMDGNRLCDPGEDPKTGNCIPIKRGTPFFGR